MPLSLEEIRSLVLQALRETGWNQVSHLEIAVGDLKAKMLGSTISPSIAHLDGRVHLERGESNLINEVIWSFIIQGILVPGIDDSNQGWPFLRLTEYGKKCVEAREFLPHDPDRYLDDFDRLVPSADAVIREYLVESVQCFVRDLHRAAAVMLGGASERAIFLLIDSYVKSIADAGRRAQAETQVEKAPSIFRKWEVFEKGFPNAKAKMPIGLTDNADSLLRGVFDLIRNTRNEAGHPASGILVSRDTNYSHLRLFIPYCQRVYGLIDWLGQNKT